MKASLSISWNKLQTLRRSAVIVINEVILQTYMFKNIIMHHRWLKVFNVSLASEKKQRALVEQDTGHNKWFLSFLRRIAWSHSKNLHLCMYLTWWLSWQTGLQHTKGWETGVVCTINYWDKHSTQNSRDSLMWHDGTIPSDEIRVNVGGDKRHGSFKFNMQSWTLLTLIPHETQHC